MHLSDSFGKHLSDRSNGLGVKRAPQSVTAVTPGAHRDGGVATKDVKAVEAAGIDVEFDSNPGPHEALRVSDVLINEEVECGACDESGWQA